MWPRARLGPHALNHSTPIPDSENQPFIQRCELPPPHPMRGQPDAMKAGLIPAGSSPKLILLLLPSTLFRERKLPPQSKEPFSSEGGLRQPHMPPCRGTGSLVRQSFPTKSVVSLPDKRPIHLPMQSPYWFKKEGEVKVLFFKWKVKIF